MKKILSLALCAVLSLTLLSGCGSTVEKKILRVYNWNDYIAEDTIEKFEEETGITVVYDTYVQNEDMYTKVKAMSEDGYDLVIPSDYMIEKMIKENMLAEINYDNIPNFSLIDDSYKNLSFDPGNKYSVPYMWGTLGITYNTTKVTAPVTSWSALFDPQYEQKIFMWDSVRDSIGVALKLQGYSMNSRDTAELDAAKAKLIAQKPLVRAYAGDDIKDSMINEEGALAMMYSGDAYFAMADNGNLAYALPEEGTNLWFDNMCVIAGSKNQTEAEMFINFMCRTDIALANCEYIEYNTPQSEAFQMLPDEVKNDQLLYPSDEYLAKCEVYIDIGSDITVYNDIWTAVGTS